LVKRNEIKKKKKKTPDLEKGEETSRQPPSGFPDVKKTTIRSVGIQTGQLEKKPTYLIEMACRSAAIVNE
jgi:hypothetical protein